VQVSRRCPADAMTSVSSGAGTQQVLWPVSEMVQVPCRCRWLVSAVVQVTRGCRDQCQQWCRDFLLTPGCSQRDGNSRLFHIGIRNKRGCCHQSMARVLPSIIGKGAAINQWRTPLTTENQPVECYNPRKTSLTLNIKYNGRLYVSTYLKSCRFCSDCSHCSNCQCRFSASSLSVRS